MDPRDRAAHAAVAHVVDGMIVGLGSGDTASRAIRLLAGRAIVGMATSEKSAALARSLGIVVRAPDEVARIDLTIDGADEIDPAAAAHQRRRRRAHAREAGRARFGRAHRRRRCATSAWRGSASACACPSRFCRSARRWTLARLVALALGRRRARRLRHRQRQPHRRLRARPGRRSATRSPPPSRRSPASSSTGSSSTKRRSPTSAP